MHYSPLLWVQWRDAVCYFIQQWTDTCLYTRKHEHNTFKMTQMFVLSSSSTAERLSNFVSFAVDLITRCLMKLDSMQLLADG